MQKSEQINELAAALAKARSDIQAPTFDRRNSAFDKTATKNTYASLAAVIDAAIPKLAAHGIAVVQALQTSDRGVVCETMLAHSSGQWIAGSFEMPVNKHDAHAFGSAATYARRYSLMAFCGIVGEQDDDDGNAASKPNEAAQQKPATPTDAQRREAQQWVEKLDAAATLDQLETTFKAAYRAVHAFGFASLTQAVIAAKDARKAALADEVTA